MRDAGLSRQETLGVPGKGNRDAEGTPTNRGKGRRYTQTVVSARGGVKGRGSKGEKQVPRRARDDNGEGGAYWRIADAHSADQG